jgi:hypothetical protein
MSRRQTNRHLSRRAALPALAGTIAAVAAIGLPASAATSTAVKPLSHHVQISADTYVYPLAAAPQVGSKPGLAIYERYNVEGQIVDTSGKLITVDAAGHSAAIGVVTPDMQHFSIDGPNLVAVSASDPSRVYSWAIPAEGNNPTYSTYTVHTGSRYLGAAMYGFVEIDPSGELYADNNGVTRTPLGNPFGTSTDVQGVTGPTGIVVWNDTHIAFVPFASGASITPLDTSHVPPGAPGATDTPVCWSASSVAVACGAYYDDGEDDSGIKIVFIDPLDGAPAYASSTACPTQATMLGAKAAFLSCKAKLVVMGDGSTITSSSSLTSSPISGLGGFITTGDSGHTGVLISANTKRTTTVLAASHAASEASTFTLASGSITWAENAPGKQPVTIYRRSVAPNAFDTAVTASKVSTVGGSKVAKGSIASNGSTIVYGTRYVNSSIGQDGGETLRVVTPTGTRTVTGVDRYGTVALGDHRLAYFTVPGKVQLYDLRTRKTTKLAATAYALSGPRIAYLDGTGTLRVKDLDTGAITVVTTGLAGPYEGGGLFLYGTVVGWNGYRIGAPLTADREYVDISSPAAPKPVPTGDALWSLTDAGIVLEQPVDVPFNSPTTPGPSGLRIYAGETFELQTYDGSAASTLLTGDYLMAGPQVAGKVVAWIDQHGQLEARDID